MASRHAPLLFPSDPNQVPIGDGLYRNVEPYRYLWVHEGVLHRLTVPEDFVNDKASVPRLVRWAFDMDAIDRAALPHDFLHYWRGHLPEGAHEYWDGYRWVNEPRPWSLYDTDRLFFRMMREDPKGPPRWQRRVVFKTVRTFGKKHWDDGGWL